MQNGKRIFSLLGGIFLIVAGVIYLGGYLTNILRYGFVFNFGVFLSTSMFILMSLCGLFLLLRKTTPAAIMILVVALLYLIISIQNVTVAIRSGRGLQNVAVYALIIASYILFGIGLFKRKTAAFLLCIIAAGVRFFAQILSLILNGATLRGVSSYFSTLLLIAGMVMAALYLKGSREAAPQYEGAADPRYPAGACPQQWSDPAAQQQNGSGGWKPYP